MYSLVLVELDSALEALNRLLELLLVEEDLAVVVGGLAAVGELLEDAAEGGHGLCDLAHLVLGDGGLDVGEDEGVVELDRLLVVGNRLLVLAHDEEDLAAVVVNVGVVGVVADGSLKVAKGRDGVAELHVDGRNLDPRLDKVGDELERLFEVGLGADRVADEELEGAAEVVGLGLALRPRDALGNGLIDKRDSVGVVGGLKGVEREQERLVALRGVLGESGLGVRAERGKVRRDEGGRGELGLARGKELLGAAGRELLQTPLDGGRGGLVLETLDDGARGEVYGVSTLRE